MFKVIVILWLVGVQEPTILDDKLGPYPTIEKCFHRGATIIKVVVAKTDYAIAKAESICFEMKLKGLNT